MRRKLNESAKKKRVERAASKFMEPSRMRLLVRVVSFGLVGLSMCGCIGGGKGLSSEDRERLKANILEAPPSDIAHKLDVNLENKLHLIGYKFEPEVAPPGTEIKLTYYWRADDVLEKGWVLFTHVQYQGSSRIDNLDNNGPLRTLKDGRQILGPDRWERGKIYVDEQTWTVPADVKGSDTRIYVGVYKGDARLRVSEKNDGNNRILVGTIKTGLPPAPDAPSGDKKSAAHEVPQLTATKLGPSEKIAIDGKGDDKAWESAAGTGAFVDVSNGKPNSRFPVNGSAKITWDDSSLYVLFSVTDSDITGYFTDPKSQPASFTATAQPMLWTKDTVEMMVDPDGDGDNKDYYELQINPQNRAFHSQFDSYNAPKTEPQGPFGHEDWDPKLKSAVVVDGTIDKAGDSDKGYAVELQIPWKAFAKGAKNLPPKSGDTWRINFYAMENNGGVSWSPILGQGNFHKATRFGRVTFSDGSKPGAVDAGSDAAVPNAIVEEGGLRLMPRPIRKP